MILGIAILGIAAGGCMPTHLTEDHVTENHVRFVTIEACRSRRLWGPVFGFPPMFRLWRARQTAAGAYPYPRTWSYHLLQVHHISFCDASYQELAGSHGSGLCP